MCGGGTKGIYVSRKEACLSLSLYLFSLSLSLSLSQISPLQIHPPPPPSPLSNFCSDRLFNMNFRFSTNDRYGRHDLSDRSDRLLKSVPVKYIFKNYVENFNFFFFFFLLTITMHIQFYINKHCHTNFLIFFLIALTAITTLLVNKSAERAVSAVKKKIKKIVRQCLLI